MMGGGVGGLSCAEFLNAMAEMRQLGGAHTIEGANRINVWTEYALGFQTGFNVAAPGTFDIFSAFKDDPAPQVLYGVEPLCRDHPEEKFGSALATFAEGLMNRRRH
jgi:hypothetical protein